MSEFRVSTATRDLDLGTIHRFLSEESAWARGIPLDTVRRAVANSLNFGGYVDGKQVAYARVVTDQATFAYMADVFVLKEHRGKGYSKQLVEAVVSHPGLQGLRRFMLATSDAHGLYEQFGFTPAVRPQTMMEKFVPDAYRREEM